MAAVEAEEAAAEARMRVGETAGSSISQAGGRKSGNRGSNNRHKNMVQKWKTPKFPPKISALFPPKLFQSSGFRV